MPSLDSEAYQTWPQILTDIVTKPMDMLMLNRVKGSYCEIRVPPMGLLYPKLLVPDVYPPPPRSWFNDYDEDMLEDTWHTDFPRRSDISDNFYPGINIGLPMWESYHSFDN
ncbi:hypothetical protein CUMW_143090 [Citrus unshiu]|nr:hypothetical protein CUMW_143090 [Citrus unshiu]